MSLSFSPSPLSLRRRAPPHSCALPRRRYIARRLVVSCRCHSLFVRISPHMSPHVPLSFVLAPVDSKQYEKERVRTRECINTRQDTTYIPDSPLPQCLPPWSLPVIHLMDILVGTVAGAFFPDSGSLLTRKITLPKTTPVEAVVLACSSPQAQLCIHYWFPHTFVVRWCGKIKFSLCNTEGIVDGR